LNEQKGWFEAELAQVLANPNGIPKALHDSMAYSLYAGGKRLRPILAIAGCATTGTGNNDRSLVSPFACTLEMIHTYSLIHDDLPAMDDDDLRRGHPTNHKVYGEAVAIVAGDALLTEAFAWICDAYKPVVAEGRLSASIVLDVIADLARAAGMRGMAGGQIIDLEYEGKSGVTLTELEELHRLKTGRLLEASVALGAKLAGATTAQIGALGEYGASIGLAFQLADDILDIEGCAEIGKDIGSDAARGKVTYPALLGLDRSKALAREWVEKATAALKSFGPEADPLRQIAAYVIERKV
jgi:geranylgeranyl diphosphate synthase type II